MSEKNQTISKGLHGSICRYLMLSTISIYSYRYLYVIRIPTVVVTEDPSVPVRLVAVRGDVLLPSRVPTHEDTGLGAETVHTGQKLGHIRPW